MVSEFVKVDQVKRIVSMPKMCSIFLNDFVSRKISTPQSMDCLRALIPYLRSDDRNAVIRMMNEQTFHPATHTIIIKFQNFDFRCRSLTLYDERKLPSPYTSSGKITK